MNTMRVRGGLLVPLLVVVALGAAGWWGFGWYQARQRHEAAVRHCGAKAFEAFETRLQAALQDFDRVTEAAQVAPRMTLAPLILKMSESIAATRAVPAPPCAQRALEAIAAGMDQRKGALVAFASQEGDVAEKARSATDAIKAGIQLLEAARASKVAD